MKDTDCVRFLQWLLPQLGMRWPGFRKVRRQVGRRIDRRLAELELADVRAYQSWVEAHPEELGVLDRLCRITISRFYRDRGVFDFLRTDAMPRLAEEARADGRTELSCWSAGCASGEEPYTLNVIWKEELAARFPDLTCRILATDSNPRMLERARRAQYPESSLKDLPAAWRERCFVVAGDLFELLAAYRTGITWQAHDIRDPAPVPAVDLLLCRHLAFTYFDVPLQRRVLDELTRCLRPGGVFVTGTHEQLPESPSLHPYGGDLGVYRKRSAVVERS